MFKKILVPTDGSQAALYAAETIAVRLTPVDNAQITVVVVIAPMDWNLTDFDAEFIGEQNRQMRLNAERVLAKTVDIFARHGIAHTSKILEGNPVSAAIACEAREGDYDLIAMSSRGMSRQADSLHYMGSVTEHIIRRVSMPVLVIPPPEANQ